MNMDMVLAHLHIQCTLNYLCMDYLVCGLSLHDHKLLMTNDKAGK